MPPSNAPSPPLPGGGDLGWCILAWGARGGGTTCSIWGAWDGLAMSLASRTGCTVEVGAHQRLWFEILDDGVLTDRQVVLVATEDQAVVH